jgi:hypothetical protein
MNSDTIPMLSLVCLVLAGLVIVGIAIDWWRKWVDRPWRSSAVRYEASRPHLSMAETARWNKRLAGLHEIDPPHPGGDVKESVTLITPEDR